MNIEKLIGQDTVLVLHKPAVNCDIGMLQAGGACAPVRSITAPYSIIPAESAQYILAVDLAYDATISGELYNERREPLLIRVTLDM